MSLMKTPAVAFLILLLLAGMSPSVRAGVDAADEYEIKAAMFLNLLRLVDWPANKRDVSTPLVVGVAGSDDMARALEAVAKSKSGSSGRRIVVRRLSGATGIEECHSVFLGGGDRKRIQSELQALENTPVLTVGENDRFIALGGMIDLMVRDDRVQIEVNLDLARNQGIGISSQLLKIAVVKSGGSK
jgi:hypothetical protein